MSQLMSTPNREDEATATEIGWFIVWYVGFLTAMLIAALYLLVFSGG